MKRTLHLLAACLVLALPAAAGAVPNEDLASQCADGLEKANAELDFARAKGFSGTVNFAKAATLLTGAKIQEQFEKYPNCIDKVDRARAYIRMSQH
jgi:hypothetical protein